MSRDYDPRYDLEYDDDGKLIGPHPKECCCDECEGQKDAYWEQKISERLGK